MEIAIVFCCFYSTPSRVSSIIQKTLSRCPAFARSDCASVVIVDNRIDASISTTPAISRFSNISLTSISGSSNFLDISAYHEGLDFLINRKPKFDFYLFCNDSTFSRHSFTLLVNLILARLTKLANTCSKQPLIVGHKRLYNDIIHVNPVSNYNFFFPTDIFALNSASLVLANNLYSNLSSLENKLLQSSDPFDHLLQYLFNEKLGVWKPASLTSLSPELLRKKRATVLYEHYLSGSIAINSGILHAVNTSKYHILLLFIYSQIGLLKKVFYQLITRFLP